MKHIQNRDVVRYYIILAISLINFYFFFWGENNDYTTIFQTIIFIFALSGKRGKKTLLFISFFTSFLLVEYILTFFSIYRPNSFHYLTRIVFIFCFVFSMSKSIKYLNIYRHILFYANIIVVLLGIQTLFAYKVFTELAKINGFSDFLDIKFLFNVNGIPANIWFTIILSFISFPILGLIHSQNKNSKKFYLFTFAIVLASVFISFSRGIYLALFSYASFFLVLIWHFKPHGYKVDIQKFIFITTLFCVAIIFINYENVINTIDVFHASESQNKSIEGRLKTWEALPELSKDYFVLGVGSNNYPIHYNRFNPNQSFYSLAPSSLIQLFIEKGVLGIGIYFVFFLGFIFIIHKKIRVKSSPNQVAQIIVFLATIGSILVREISFSSLFWNNGVVAALSVLFILSFSGGENFSISKKYTQNHQNIRRLLMGLLVLISIESAKHILVKETINKAIIVNNNTIGDSKKTIEKAFSYDDNNAYYHYLLAETVMIPDASINHETTHLFSNIGKLSLSIPNLKPPILNEVSEVYKKIININKHDDEAFHNLGWICLALNKTQEAINFFNKAIIIHPKNAMYHLSLGLAIELKGSKKTALKHYEKAIYLSPFILDSQFFKDLCDRYPIESKTLVNNLIAKLETENNVNKAPFVKAKLGKLYMYNGKVMQADTLLKKVTEILPNLTKPWENLSEIALLKKETDIFRRYNKKAIFLHRSNYINYYNRANFSHKKHTDFFIENYQQSIFYWTQKILYSNTKANWLYKSPIKNHCNNVIMRCFVAYSNPVLPVKNITTQLGKYYEDIKDDQGIDHYYYELSKSRLSRLNHENTLNAHF